MPGVAVLVGMGCLWVAVSYEEGRVILRICFVYVSYILRSGWGTGNKEQGIGNKEQGVAVICTLLSASQKVKLC